MLLGRRGGTGRGDALTMGKSGVVVNEFELDSWNGTREVRW